MLGKLCLRDGRAYVHTSDLVACIAGLFSDCEIDEIEVRFRRPTVFDFLLLESGGVTDIQMSDAPFLIKTSKEKFSRTYYAVPVCSDEPLQRLPSASHLLDVDCSVDGMRMRTAATSIAEFICDLVMVMKKHWGIHSPNEVSPMVVRVKMRMPFLVPEGEIVGTVKWLKMGACCWDIVAPENPGFHLSMTGFPVRV